MFDSAPFWAIATVGGPLILAIVIAYALLNRRRLSSREKQERDAATRRLYGDENRNRS